MTTTCVHPQIHHTPEGGCKEPGCPCTRTNGTTEMSCGGWQVSLFPQREHYVAAYRSVIETESTSQARRVFAWGYLRKAIETGTIEQIQATFQGLDRGISQ